MSPYVVTTKRPVDAVDAGHPEAPKDGWPVSRHAVATLKEAHERIGWTAFPAGPTPLYAAISSAITESGGKVGPLLDGTVIEVQPTTYGNLAEDVGVWDAGHELARDEILAAFNARETTR